MGRSSPGNEMDRTPGLVLLLLTRVMLLLAGALFSMGKAVHLPLATWLGTCSLRTARALLISKAPRNSIYLLADLPVQI